MNLLELLARFVEYLFVWFPRPVYTPQYEASVVWTGRRDPVVKTGLWAFVPLFQATERVDLRDQATEFEPKVLWTRDGREAAVGMVVVWNVADPLVCCRRVDALGTMVSKLGESVLPELVGKFDLAELKRKAAGGEGREWGFDAHLRLALTQALDTYGLAVSVARLNFTSDRVRTFKLIGSAQDFSPVSFEGIA